MQNPLEFYISEKECFKEKLSSIKKRLATSSLIRLGVFSAIFFSIYFFFGNAKIMGIIGVLGFALFLYLVSRHADLQYKRNVFKALLEINLNEISVLKGDYLTLNKGKEFQDPAHFFSYDIDLFGRGSFFQYINRTATHEGKVALVKRLTENAISDIEIKQEATQELSKTPKWRQQFSALASLVKVQHPAKDIINWIHNYKPVFSNIVAYLPSIFSIISLIFITLVSFQLLSFNILVIWFFVGLGTSSVYFKRVNTIYKDADKAKDTFKQYYKLLHEIEITTFTSQLLKEKQKLIQTENKKASVIFAFFSKILDALDQRNNLIIAIFGNALFLRDTQQAYKIEQWINTYANKVENWFEVIAFFDAQNSLGNFAFNHPKYIFPIISNDKEVIKAKKLGHPLLKVKKRIDNDFKIENQQFFIITGANMAGKSTFLRTVSLAIVMANMGLPVCAEKMDYSPIKLITSMRTTDSLADDESYFFSELKRLKFIVEEIKSERYFIILDEILKGTNSTDKAIGSKKFVQKLVASNSTGIIATHDLSLCEIEKELTEIQNYYFDAEIINDELYFDYKLKDGICKNMNASFLLKKMEII
ncbi:MAG: DNA mismatch repair protein MutS [Flavobacteriaceae bacterium]|nr:DNA mismatch repair protein MutS [Flavobacteriaceae bacterium]